MEDCEFYDSTVTGQLDGNSVLNNCRIQDLQYIEGEVRECILGGGTITLLGNAIFLDCWADVPGVDSPVIDLGGSGAKLELRNYNGDVKLINKTGTEEISIDLNSGKIVLDSTITGGTVVIRGVGWVVNNGSATLDLTGLVNVQAVVDGIESSDSVLALLSFTEFIKEIEGGKWQIVPGSPTQMVFYKDDNVTEVARFDIAYDDDGNPIMRTRV